MRPRVLTGAVSACFAFILAANTAHADLPVCTPAPAPELKAAAKADTHAIAPLAAPAALSRPVQMCFDAPAAERACLAPRKPCNRDLEIANIAWKYFQNNYQPATGMTNAADKYPSAAMWDLGSALGATLAARHFGIIDQKDFDDRVVTLLATLSTMKLYRDEAPNKAYNTATATMTDYNNKPSDGIGFSALDIARLASFFNVLACLYPKHEPAARGVLGRWKFDRIVHDGQMWGTLVDPASKKESVVQEGRLGYEQYGGKMFAVLGFDQHVSSNYRNPHASTVSIYDVPVSVDDRDPRKFGAYNYVVTESYALDAMEFGADVHNATLIRNIFEVQKRRWQHTGIVTAVSEDNVDRSPHFLYNTIYAAGSAWNTITDAGVDYDTLKSVSTKAAFSLVSLFPTDSYAPKLLDTVSSAYDKDRGWYSGVYEAGLGYNKITTANTNGIILEALLFKAFGPLNAACKRCDLGLKYTPSPKRPEAPSCPPSQTVASAK